MMQYSTTYNNNLMTLTPTQYISYLWKKLYSGPKLCKWGTPKTSNHWRERGERDLRSLVLSMVEGAGASPENANKDKHAYNFYSKIIWITSKSIIKKIFIILDEIL